MTRVAMPPERLAIGLLGRLACVLAIAIAAGCDSLPGRPTEADRPILPTQVKDFRALYGTNCAGCHGADGRLGPARSLNDPVYLTLIGDAELKAVVAAGVPGTAMPAFGVNEGGTLTSEQIDTLVGEMRSRWGRPGQLAGVALPPYRADAATGAASGAGAPERGAEVYARACASCHGAEGRGGAAPGAILDGSYLALVSDQSLRTTVIAGRTDLGMPDWRGEPGGTPLSAQDVSDVVAWLAAKRPRFAGQPAQQSNRTGG